MTETEQLAEHIATVRYEDIPDDAIEHAKLSIRNFVGLAVHGSNHSDSESVRSYLEAIGSDGGATVIGYGTADPVRAALANGAFGHILEYDDTFESVVIHPSCSVFPAALAATEMVDGNGADLIKGFVVGLDVLFRLGRSVAPSHWHDGWHSTATIGAFGATAAAVSILDLNAEEAQNALGLAGSFSSGLKKNVGWVANPIHSGHAAAKGVEAAILSREGATANTEILEGEYGYGNVATSDDGYHPEEITDPKIEWAVTDNAFKPYPSGVVTHSAMEALRSIVEREDLTPEDVEEVIVLVDERVMDTVNQHDPQTAVAATVSYEFCLAAILRERDVGLAEFTDEYVQDSATREAMEKITRDPRPDPFGSNDAEASYGARITVETTDGATFEEEMQTAPGGPSNPLPEERWRAKFEECTKDVLDQSATDRLWDSVMELDADGALSDLTSTARLE